MSESIIKSEQRYELAVSGEELVEVIAGIAEEMDGLGSIQFTKVKVPNGGAKEFDVDGNDVKEIVGVIVARTNENVRFEGMYDPNGENAPACRSNDGKVGVDQAGVMHDCATCPHNQWKQTGGKGCSNKVNVYILESGNLLPIQLVLPPTSIKSIRDYVAKSLLAKGMRTYQVVTRVTLEKIKGAYDYSLAKFEVVERLDAQAAASMKAYADNFKGFLDVQNAVVGVSQETAYAVDQAVAQFAAYNDSEIPF